MIIPVGGQIELYDSPKDGISELAFGNEADVLMASSWDTNLYLYDAPEGRLTAKVPLEAALLTCCFGQDDLVSYAGGLGRQVLRINWSTMTSTLLGTHQEAVKALCRCKGTGLLFSGSWDRTLTSWDVRGERRIRSISLPGKVYTMDVCQHMLVVGMSDRHIHIYDTRKMEEPVQRRESSLKYQTRCIRCFPSGEGYVCTSIEGRVAVEYFDAAEEVQANKYAFKCHRAPIPEQENTEMVYPVNAVAFHPIYGTFCTGGSDAIVNVWDRLNKKRIRQYPKYHSSISSLAFSRDGSLLAIAPSYCYEEGEKDHEPDSIFVRALEENEAKPKHWHGP